MNVAFKKTDTVDSTAETEIVESSNLRSQVIDPYIKLFARLKLLAISILSVIVLLYLFYSLIMNKDQSMSEKMEIVSKLLTATVHIGALGQMHNNTVN